jgi:hypothetical protein
LKINFLLLLNLTSSLLLANDFFTIKSTNNLFNYDHAYLWCDEFFIRHYDIDELRAKTSDEVEGEINTFIKLPVINKT